MPRALLTLLACRAGWWTREALVARLRPDSDETEAYRYLRQLLHRARHLPEGASLETDGDRVRWQIASDVARLREGLRSGDAEALSIPVEAFLEGWRAPCRSFAAWMEAERADLLRARRRLARNLATARSRSGDPAAAAEAAEVLLRDDPLDEATVVDVARWRLAAGDAVTGLAVIESFRQRLAEEVGEGPSTATEALAAGLRSALAAPEPGSARSPIDAVGFATPFHGREEEQDRLIASVEDGGSKVVALVGLGGTGKTRLAFEAAARVEEAGVRVAWVSCGDVAEEPIAERVAWTLPVLRDVSGAEARWQAWIDAGPGVLILDEVEDLVADPASDLHGWYARVLPTLGASRLWLTTRVAPRWAAVTVQHLDGLAVPPPGCGAAEARGAAAVRLLLARAGFEPGLSSDADVLAAAEVARGVGGHPLAIELLAASTRGVPPSAAFLDGHRVGPLPLAEAPDMRSDHRDLNALLAATWGALPIADAACARRLVTFRGHFDLQAARTVGSMDAATLSRLFDRAMVQRVGLDRYTLHPLLRRAAPPAEPSDLDAHASWALGLAEAAGRRLRADGHAEALAELMEQAEDVRAAWSHAVARATQGWKEALDLLEAALEPLDHAWHAHGRLGVASSAFAEALAAAGPAQGGSTDAPDRRWPGFRARVLVCWSVAERNLGRTGAALEELTLLAEAGDDVDAGARAGALLELAKCHAMLDRPAEAQRGFREVLREAKRAQRPDLEAAAHVGLARMLWASARDVEEALLHDDAALLAARRDGDPDALMIALINAGAGTYELGRLEEAEHRWREAIGLAEHMGHRAREAAVLNNLGLAALRRDRPEEARAAFERSLSLRRASGDRRGQASVLINLGQMEAAMGLETASLEEAIAVFSELGEEEDRSLALSAWSEAASAQGDGRRGEARAQAALAAAQASTSVRARLCGLLALAKAWRAEGAGAEAAALATRVRDLAMGRSDSVHRGAAALLAGMAAPPAPDGLVEDGKTATMASAGWPGTDEGLDGLVRAVLVGRIGRRDRPPAWNAAGTGRR